MNNFSVHVEGKEYWISRSVATCGFVFKRVNNTIYVLIEQRGIGAADNIHSYCVPCGFLDYSETGKECIKREIMEEVGLCCDVNKLKLIAVNTNPNQNRQNISLHYVYFADINENYDINTRHGGEVNEIEKVDWLPVANIYNKKIELITDSFNNKTWAFNHDKLIKKYVENYEALQEIQENVLDE